MSEVVKKENEDSKKKGLTLARILLILFTVFWNLIVIMIPLAMIGETEDLDKVDWSGLPYVIPFALAGIGLIYLVFKPDALSGLIPKEKSPPPADEAQPNGKWEAGEVELAPSQTTASKLTGMLVFCIFYNVIVFLSVGVDLINDIRNDTLEWQNVCLTAPFILIGIGTVFAVFYFVLALANPRPVLTVSSRRMKPGEEVDIAWKVAGNAGRLENFRMYIEGREEATYWQGTERYTDKSVFTTIELVEAGAASKIRQGSVKAVVPADTMHSFNGASNKIAWSIRVHGEIPRWPDVKEEFEIEVRPFDPEELKLTKDD